VYVLVVFLNVEVGRKEGILNVKCTRLGSLDARGKSLVSIFMPFARAPGGRKERKRRAVFALGLKGLKTVFTSVMNLVIILKMSDARLSRQVN
jgi:hypothetical protein